MAPLLVLTGVGSVVASTCRAEARPMRCLLAD